MSQYKVLDFNGFLLFLGINIGETFININKNISKKDNRIKKVLLSFFTFYKGLIIKDLLNCN
jgi:hypothetical protein